MNPVTLKDAKQLYSSIKKVASKARRTKVMIFAPAIYLSELKKLSGAGSKVELGAQDCHTKDQGAQTGEISAFMIRDLGVKITLVGHSERRAAGETDEAINQKIKTAISAGLRIILCVGETERDDSGDYLDILRVQIEKDLADFPAKQADKLIIAYEPVWAISTTKGRRDATPDDFLHSKIFIRKILAGIIGKKKALLTPVLFGGYASPENTIDFLVAGQADGLLSGRNSLSPKNFAEIIKIAEHAK